jgi:hypothetical protein
MHHLALLAGLAAWAAAFAFCVPWQPVTALTLYRMGVAAGVAGVVGAVLLAGWFLTATGWLRWRSLDPDADAELLDWIDPDEPR